MASENILTPAAAHSQDDDGLNKAICKLCRRQFAKYTCPACNVPYCSLTCFRSSSHSQCSETFYKNELQFNIATTPSRTTEERRQMMELLKRFEDEATREEEILSKEVLGAGESQESGDPLVERFAGLDLDTLSFEDMWQILTPEEKETFTKAVKDPSSELAQRLLRSEELEHELEQPWWLNDAERLDHEPKVEEKNEYRIKAPRPTAIHIPQSMVKQVPHGRPLAYNMAAICLAYSYTIRHLGIRMLSALTPVNPVFEQAARLITDLVPFLFDRRSTTLHPSVAAATIDIYSRFQAGQANSELLAVLLEDAAILMRPLRVIPVPPVSPEATRSGSTLPVDPSAHPHLMPILVLSDLNHFFQSGQEASDMVSSRVPSQERQGQPPSNTPSATISIRSELNKMHTPGYQHVVRKLEFYIAHILTTPSGTMESVAEEALWQSRKSRADDQSLLRRTS